VSSRLSISSISCLGSFLLKSTLNLAISGWQSWFEIHAFAAPYGMMNTVAQTNAGRAALTSTSRVQRPPARTSQASRVVERCAESEALLSR
jgi:hypothetical protein